MTLFYDTRFNPERICCMGKTQDDLWKRRNFDLCRAINMTNLHCVIGEMVASGDLDRNLADLYLAQAGSLLALMRTENNRGMGF